MSGSLGKHSALPTQIPVMVVLGPEPAQGLGLERVPGLGLALEQVPGLGLALALEQVPGPHRPQINHPLGPLPEPEPKSFFYSFFSSFYNIRAKLTANISSNTHHLLHRILSGIHQNFKNAAG